MAQASTWDEIENGTGFEDVERPVDGEGWAYLKPIGTGPGPALEEVPMDGEIQKMAPLAGLEVEGLFEQHKETTLRDLKRDMNHE